MKCIQCNTDNNLRDRNDNQGNCKYCGHAFAFEPTTMEKIKFTDPFFAKLINDISTNNTLYFTPRQFLYMLNRRLERKNFSLLGMIFFYIFFSIWTTGFVGGLLSIIIGRIAFPLVLVLYNLGCIFYLFKLSNSETSSYKTRQSSAKGLIILGIIIILVGMLISLNIDNLIGFLLGILIGGLAIRMGIVQKRQAMKKPHSFLINMAQTNTWLNQWRRANGQVSLLLTQKPSLLKSNTPNNNQPSEVTAYSFDRLIVCESDEIAQMLIANNFHFEHNCAILSISGYPQHLFDTIMTMLRRNPELKVFTLHNCSPAGMKIIHQLRIDPIWFVNSNVTIIDIGLSPRQIIDAGKSMFVLNTSVSAKQAQNLDPEIRQNLSSEELHWLDAGNFVELESFSPQKLIRILQRSFANSEQRISENESNLLSPEIGDGADGYLFYAIDSFG
jgi:hypothetical protein